MGDIQSHTCQEGIYAEIRDLVYSRDRIMKTAQHICKQDPEMDCNTFPEYLGLYTRFDAISGLAVLEKHHCQKM